MANEQSEIATFLAQPGSYPWPVASIDKLTTHGAVVFLAGEFAIKLKRAVAYPYMDFSTLDLRHRVLLRELELNHRSAPEIYLDVLPITRDGSGALALNGEGTVVEWVLRMRRFPQSALMSHLSSKGALAPSLCEAVADAIAASHAAARLGAKADGPGRLLRDAAQIETAFADASPQAGSAAALQLTDAIRHSLGAVASQLAARARGGLVRRCHGDLHLANIVVWNDKPTLFDAIEFDNAIATVDVLYDLAFLLMDLELAGQRAAANRVLGRYLWRTRRPGDLDALASLPTMLALRAGIRAMVALQRATSAPESRDTGLRDVHRYLTGAARFLAPPAPRLIAIGGLSGTGKSTLAAALAPLFGASPGALHLRSDLQRKADAGVEPTERLPAGAYTSTASARVYAALIEQTRRAIAAGHSVVVDAVFAEPREREAIAAVATAAKVPFDGLWLEAPQNLLETRVESRRNDASDATAQVVRTQTGYDTGPITWTFLDATASPAVVLQAARGVLRHSP